MRRTVILRLAFVLPSLGASYALAGEVNLGRLEQFPPAFVSGAPSSAVPGRDELLRRGYREGAGAAFVSAGRFGFLKGDGLLDCAYPTYGLIEKAHLTAHPENKAQRRWAIKFHPPGAVSKRESKRSPYRTLKPTDDMQVNWVSVVWDSNFIASEDFYGRKRGVPVKFRVTYNITSPGILIETDDHALRFNLDETPGYSRIVLPLRQGVTVREFAAGQNAYSAVSDGRLADNWILLWGSRAFPDVPLLLVLKDNPTEVIPAFADTKLTALTLRYASQVGYVIAATPFGLEGLLPAQTSAPDWLTKTVPRCRFWSKTLLAYIINCKEYYTVDEATNAVTILQEYEYRRLTDIWDSQAIPIAPYPPTLSMAAAHCRAIQLSPRAVDLEFPTKYGPLKAVVGTSWSEYTLPIPPVSTHIPLPPMGDTAAKRVIRERHRVAPHDPTKPLPSELFPGFWSRPDRSVPDSVSMVGDWYLIWLYMDEASRQALKRNAREFLIDCLDDQPLFEQTALFQSIQKTPQDADKLTRPLWFERTEPYTQAKYMVSYTVPCVRAQGRSIPDYEGTFTDLEWGNGWGLYGIYQLARLSDGWDVVRKNWKLVKGIYRLFESFHDWACMSASGCEHGRRWTDTTSYGGYVGFREMARRVGDMEAWQRAVYLHAKHAALRLAMFNSGTYVNTYYAAKPWKVHHDFVEMARDYSSLLYEPLRWGTLPFLPNELQGDDVLIHRNSLYSLVAEGPIYECPDMFYTLMPEATAEFVRLYNEHFPAWTTEAFCQSLNERHRPSGGITALAMLLFQLRDPTIETAVIERQFDEA